MSNVINKFGYLPIGRQGGGPWSVEEFCKVVAHTQALFRGDMVAKSAVSGVSPFAGNPMPGVTSLQNGTPGTTLWLGATINYGAPAAITPQYVCDDPFTVFICQGDDNTSLNVADSVGKNALLITGTGNAVTKQSTMSFDASALTTSASTIDVRVVGLLNRPDNVEGAYAIVEVIIVKHANAQGSIGV
jgi:hypothetical protein